jgi:hypothetical protein
MTLPLRTVFDRAFLAWDRDRAGGVGDLLAFFKRAAGSERLNATRAAVVAAALNGRGYGLYWRKQMKNACSPSSRTP